MMRTMTSAEAQSHFGELLDTAQHETVSITRRGRTVAFILSPKEYDVLSREAKAARNPSAAQATIAAFHGSGPPGATEALLQDRQDDRLREE